MNWTRDQLLAALNLYHRTPFGRQHSTYPPIVKLAELIGRTPGAVAMKLNNFTSLDPAELERGIKALTGASKTDREIWAAFADSMNALADESEASLERFQKERATLSRTEPPEDPAPPTGPSETLATVKVRRQQRFFRRTVLASYGHRCCITGNPVPEFLRASHIIPWAESEEHRADPSNGLCLAATFDAAFDRGLISFDDDYRLLLAPRLDTFLPNPALEASFVATACQKLALPEKNLPDPAHLAWHRMYYQVFPKMIEAWRAAFEDPELPFGIISLCTDGTSQTLDNYLEMMVNEGMYIREVQYRTFLDLSRAGDGNIGFVSSYDQRRNWYHPQLKVPVGERIAMWALATQYGQGGLSWKPPEVTGVEAGDGTLILTFDVPVDQPSDYPIEGFAIAGKDRMFQPAVAEHAVTGVDDRQRPIRDFSCIVLSSPHVEEPVHYRYAWGRNPMGNLYPRSAKDGQPVATQRSDDWRIHEVPVTFGEEHQETHTRELQKWKAQWLTPPGVEGQ